MNFFGGGANVINSSSYRIWPITFRRVNTLNEFRFAVQVSSATRDVQALSNLAHKIEDLGFSTIFFPDHLGGNQWSPLVAMTAVALATKTLKIGTLVFSNDYRHPVVLAQELATLNAFSQGRLEFGMGAGWLSSDYALAGLQFDKPSVRIARLNEAVDIVRELISGATSNYRGEFYNTSGATCVPTAHGVPKLILGGGGRKMLDLAAKKGDIVGVNVNLKAGAVGPELISEVGPLAFEERIKWVHESAKDREIFPELQCLTFVARVSNDANSWLEDIAPSFGVSAQEAKAIPIVLVGTIDEVCNTLLERRSQYGFTYWVIHEAEVEEFAPIVSRLSKQ